LIAGWYFHVVLSGYLSQLVFLADTARSADRWSRRRNENRHRAFQCPAVGRLSEADCPYAYPDRTSDGHARTVEPHDFRWRRFTRSTTGIGGEGARAAGSFDAAGGQTSG